MPRYSARSTEKLNSCDQRLQRIFNEVIKHIDCTIVTGHRGKEEQNKKFSEGLSQLKFPESKHNALPSTAIDVAPYPIDWNDRERFFYLAGLVQGIAKSMDIRLRWGGDWDGDHQFKDNRFDDLPHFELLE